MECKICGKAIPKGGGYREGTRFKNEHFCCEECYNERVRKSNERRAELEANKYKPKENTDRRKLTDCIQKIYGKEANWPELIGNVKNIEKDYELTDKELRLTLVYAVRYDGYTPDTDYNLYQFIKFIEPMKKFREQIAYSREVGIKEDEVVIVKRPSRKRIWRERG